MHRVAVALGQCVVLGLWQGPSEERQEAGVTGPRRPVRGRRRRRTGSARVPHYGRHELWITDITEHHTDERKLYMSAIKDVYSSRLVGYSIGARMKDRLAVDALEMAVARRGGDVAGCVVHSDRGSQFRSKKFTRALARHGLVGSMGRVGAAGDNAAMESFFALVQKNVLDRRRWASREQLRIAIVT